MSAARNVDLFGQADTENPTHCAVVSIYEDADGRDLLLQLCNGLATQFGDLEFHFDWWRFKYLADPEIAIEAAQTATEADLILLAPESPDLPSYMQGWFEGCLSNREQADGALVLVQPSAKGTSRSLAMRSFLRETAKRARLDYMRLKSPGPTRSGAKPIARFSLARFDLNQLLAQRGQPLHWGINE